MADARQKGRLTHSLIAEQEYGYLMSVFCGHSHVNNARAKVLTNVSLVKV